MRLQKEPKTLFAVIVTRGLNGEEIVEINPTTISEKEEWKRIALSTPRYIKHFFIMASNIREAKRICNRNLDHLQAPFWHK